jgi:hypothetical protein
MYNTENMLLFKQDNTLVDKMFDEAFPEYMRELIATNIFVATKAVKDVRDSFVTIPRIANRIAGTILQAYIDKYLIASIEGMDVNPLRFSAQEKTGSRGFAYTEFNSLTCKFHIKKTNNMRLPNAAVHRKANAESNKIFLNYGPEYMPEYPNVPFAIVIFGHKYLELQYIKIGFPTWDYIGWQQDKLLEILNYVSFEKAEKVHLKNLSIKKEMYKDIEKIEKQYLLSTK